MKSERELRQKAESLGLILERTRKGYSLTYLGKDGAYWPARLGPLDDNPQLRPMSLAEVETALRKTMMR